jgi:hypothetical protein
MSFFIVNWIHVCGRTGQPNRPFARKDFGKELWTQLTPMKGAFASFLAQTQKLPTKSITRREPKNCTVDSPGFLLCPIIPTYGHLLSATKYIGIGPPAPSFQQKFVTKDICESRRAALEGKETISWQNLAGVF